MRKNLSLQMLVLIIITTVYSFSSMTTAFYMMGSKSLVWFLISACCYFIPYALIVAQYTKKYADHSGTIYDWLKDSLSPKVAFITAFLWYCSYFTWMVSLFMKIMIPLSILFFGKDLSSQATWFGIPTQVLIATFAVIAVLFMTRLITRGFQTILSFLKISSFAMVGLLSLSLLSNITLIHLQPQDFWVNLQHSFSAKSFFEGAGDHFFSQLPFFIFSITAFGGLDTVASLADRTPDSKRRFPKAVIISAFVITTLYFGGIILWSGANNLAILRQSDQMHLGNLMYGLMGTTAKHLSSVLGLSASSSQLLYQIYIRYTAFTMFTAYVSLLSTITYGPLKSLISGTPKAIWPKKWAHLNAQAMPEKALWIQSVAVSFVIILLSLNHSFISDLFNQLTYMTNVARALPYLVVALSFPFFIQKNIVKKEQLLIQNKRINYLLAISVCLCILIAIIFQVYEPLRLGQYLDVSTLVLGPTIFAIVALYLYRKFERNAIELQ